MSAHSFFQVNTTAAEVLYDAVREWVLAPTPPASDERQPSPPKPPPPTSAVPQASAPPPQRSPPQQQTSETEPTAAASQPSSTPTPEKMVGLSSPTTIPEPTAGKGPMNDMQSPPHTDEGAVASSATCPIGLLGPSGARLRRRISLLVHVKRYVALCVICKHDVAAGPTFIGMHPLSTACLGASTTHIVDLSVCASMRLRVCGQTSAAARAQSACVLAVEEQGAFWASISSRPLSRTPLRTRLAMVPCHPSHSLNRARWNIMVSSLCSSQAASSGPQLATVLLGESKQSIASAKANKLRVLTTEGVPPASTGLDHAASSLRAWRSSVDRAA